MLIWTLAVFALGQLSGQVAASLRFTPRVEVLQAQLLEREETADNTWALYESAHCALKRAELTIAQHVWEDATFWPEGDESGIPCPTDPAGSPLLASAEDAAEEGEAPGEAPPERTAEAGRGGAQALVAAGSDAGW